MPSHRPCAACAVLAASLAAGCGGGFVFGDFDCEDETAAVIASFGSPDARDERIDHGFHIRTLWFEGTGLVISLTWSADIGCVREDRVVRR